MNKRPGVEKLVKNFKAEQIVWNEFMNLHLKKSLEEFGYGSVILDETLAVIACLIDALNYLPRDVWPKQRSTQYLFFPNICETLICAKDILFKGFYDESFILTRTAFDAVIRIVFISCFPQSWEAVIVKKPPKGSVQFVMTNFLRDNLKLPHWVDTWEVQSTMVHGKGFRVGKFMVDAQRAEQANKVSLSLKFDPKGFSVSMNQINCLCWYTLRLMKILFPVLEMPILDGVRLADSLKERYQTVIEANSEVMDGMATPILRQTKRDFEKIERIIVAAESGRDWEQLV